MMGFIALILIIIFFLAVVGLGFDTFFSGIKKGADKLVITPVMETAADDAIEIAGNASRDIVGNSLPVNK
ncbi:MAG: hypothetical protein WCE99_13200 [Nitrososphaeraceae archaeon]